MIGREFLSGGGGRGGGGSNLPVKLLFVAVNAPARC